MECYQQELSDGLRMVYEEVEDYVTSEPDNHPVLPFNEFKFLAHYSPVTGEIRIAVKVDNSPHLPFVTFNFYDGDDEVSWNREIIVSEVIKALDSSYIDISEEARLIFSTFKL